MSVAKKTVTVLALVGALGALSTKPSLADDPAFISIGAGAYDWNRKKDPGTEVRLEYRDNHKIFNLFKPFAAVSAATSSNTFFAGAGILMDLYFGKRIVLTPSFAPHYYHGGNDKLDLDYALEFRSQLELSYRFDNRSRLGVAVSHYSNASLGKTNPGTECAQIYYSIPIDVFK